MEPEPQTKVLPPGHTDATNVAPGDSMATCRSLGRYEIVQRLGHGGMATVYLGRATANAGFVEMFLEEARIAAKIQSPHIAGILDLGHEDGLHFMVMEYIDGETLSGLIRQLRPRNDRLPLAVVLQILIDACQGLTAVHDLRDADGQPYGLVHRDMRVYADHLFVVCRRETFGDLPGDRQQPFEGREVVAFRRGRT